MMLTTTLLFLVRSCIAMAPGLLLCGCASEPRPPVQTPGTNRDTFFKPYRKAFKAVAGEESQGRPLLQLGLPDSDKIVLWYARQAESKAIGKPVVMIDGGVVPQTHLRYHENSIHRTGRVEVSHLRPGTSYKVSLSGAGFEGSATATARTRSAGNVPFSFLFGSCFAPYRYGGKYAQVKPEAPEVASMGNFKTRAEGKWCQPECKGWQQPAFFLGMGDQLYVDPGAGHRKKSGLAYLYGTQSEKLRGTLCETKDYLNELYRLHYALPPMDDAFRNMPAVMMWDDHDIRDGWGSHGDEHLDDWQTYYQHARDAYVAFQAARNPNFTEIINAMGWTPELTNTDIPNNAPSSCRQAEETYFSFDHGLATFFVADGRSAKTRGPLLTGHQRQRIKEWIENPRLKDQPKVFVFSYPVPVSGRVSKTFRFGRLVSTEGQDDLYDRIDRRDQDFLFGLFTGHFNKDHPQHILVILSGDVHYSGLQSLHHGTADDSIFGYEIISSGMAQTSYNTSGGFIGTVAGTVRSDGSVWVQDRGMYSGPCFAELFIREPAAPESPPRLSLEFYVAGFTDTERGKERRAYELAPGRFGKDFPHPIDCYKPNTPGRRPGSTTNNLPDFLKKLSPPSKAN